MTRAGAYPRRQRQALWWLVLAAAAALWVGLTTTGKTTRTGGYARTATALRLGVAHRTAATERAPAERFPFDPNTVTGAELQRLGLTQRQANGWLRYRGDRPRAFRRPEDITKLYSLPAELARELVQLAVIADAEPTRARTQVQGFAYDPNVVSVADLVRLGLSEKQAGVVVRYRRAASAGGRRAFRSPEDLRRLQAMSDRQRAHLIRWAVIPPEAEDVAPAPQRFTFDPNTISADSLRLLGFPAWQARAFVTFRARSKYPFRSGAVLRRVGALDSALVEAVIPLVVIATSAPLPGASGPTGPAPASAPRTYGSSGRTLPEPTSFNVNAADTSAWKSLPGIGSFRARRIVRYRNRLGGFYDPAQITEARGVPDSVYQAIAPYLTAGAGRRTIAVNYASYDELRRHPYISRNLANSLVRNRAKFGRFTGPADLNRLRLITAENRDRILPYLNFDWEP